MNGRIWDVVIVGGGSAGCVLASRLSADPSRSVLLIEAGPDMPPGMEPAAVRDIYPGRAAYDPKNHWPGLTAYKLPFGDNTPERPPRVTYEQARIMGGGSTINGQMANRGTPDDYDGWARSGACGWDWASVLPYFKRLERDLDYSGQLHGSDGPVAIHRVPDAQWPRFVHCAREAILAQDYRDLGDQNGVFEDGAFAMSLSNDGCDRVSTARAYLTIAVRRRPNLEIRSESEVQGLVVKGRRVVGVRVARGGEAEVTGARRTVLSAGALHTPALMMRAGIGRPATLRALGIEVVNERPGVGMNLQEHPGISVSAFLRPGARLGGGTRRHMLYGLRYSSGGADAPPSDMYLAVIARSAWHPLGRRIGTLISWINRPYSVGHVELVNADPLERPVAALNFLADPRDCARLLDAVRLMARLLGHPSMARLVQGACPSSYSTYARALGRPTMRNWLLTAIVAGVLDAAPVLRSPFCKTFLGSGLGLADALADDGALEAFVRRNVIGQWHVCGTCRMGQSDDRDAVVDPRTMAVHGVDGLFVADASVMPLIPRANTNIPTIMIAERASDLIAAHSDIAT